jgi:hypothetical protein
MTESIREDLIEIMLSHFKPGEHGGSWRLNPSAAADDILAKYALSLPQQKKPNPCADGHHFVISHPPAGQWGYTQMFCQRCGKVPQMTTTTTTLKPKD